MRSVELDFTRRAHLSEWMDEPCSYAEFRDCLGSLAQVNALTLAYRPTLRWLNNFPSTQPLHIVDVGSGGGDMLRRIERWARREKRPVRLTGVDLNPYAAQAAWEATPANSGITWLTGDAFSTALPAPADVVISSLFTHHLAEGEIVKFLGWMEESAALGWFINDLHREALPYFAFKVLAQVARWHRFVRHDGPVSIRRAFREDDWQRMLRAAGLAPVDVTLQTFRPARLCVSRVKR